MDDSDIETEKDDDHTTHMALEAQPGKPRNKISSQTTNQIIFSICPATPLYSSDRPRSSPPPAIPLYTSIFDSTLGFPGEGPAKIATYNINGAKDKLYHVLGAASKAKIDVLLLQETHYYKTTHYHVNGIQFAAKRAGWTALHAPATVTDPRGGLAILVRADSQTISLVNGSAPLRGLNGRLIGAECQINDERTYIYSLYLPAKPDKD
jgi:hypothetical protein